MDTKKIDIQKLLAPAALVILYIFFCFAGKNFFSASTLVSILDSTYYVGLMAFGITFVIITSGIDLSIGTNMMMSALLAGYMNAKGANIWICLIAAVAIATFVGFLNGTLISRLKLPPFIATLGTMKVFLVALFLLNKTRFGRYTYAMGSNEEAVRLSGVNVIQWKTLVYTVCGFFCGLASIVYAATYTTIIPGTGNGLEMNAIAAVVIGGTSMAGGVGTMSGTLIGALLMSVLKTGLMSMGLQGHFQTFFTGAVVILAVLLDIYRNNKATAVK